MKPILYYAADCPDTAPFVAELKRLGVDYDAVEVLSSIPNHSTKTLCRSVGFSHEKTRFMV